jgi:hypothetical protein
MWFKRMTYLGGVWLFFVALCSFSAGGDARAQCTPGTLSVSVDGSTSMWIGSYYIPGSVIGHSFPGDIGYYWHESPPGCKHIFDRCPTPGLTCQESCYYYHAPYWQGGPLIWRYHIRYPSINCPGLFDDESWCYQRGSTTVQGDGMNHDFDCDGIPDIADPDPATPADKNLGRPQLCDFSEGKRTNSVGNPTNVGTGNKYEEALDLTVSTPGIPPEFRRSYNNQVSSDGPLGYGWTHNYDLSVQVMQEASPKKVKVWDSDGRALYFTEVS